MRNHEFLAEAFRIPAGRASAYVPASVGGTNEKNSLHYSVLEACLDVQDRMSIDQAIAAGSSPTSVPGLASLRFP